jgi:ketosteroid isomerase-like protein
MKATNKKLGMLFFHRLKINDANKATEEWFIDDASTMMGQLGMLPKEASPHRALMDKGMDGAPMIVVAADDDKEKANLAAFAKGNDAFNAHKAADVTAMMTDDAVESDLAEGKDTVGKKDIQAGTDMFMKGFSDSKVEVTESWAAGDYVVAIGKFTGTNDHDMGKAMKKTGKKVEIEYVEIAQLKDGKIAKLWRFRNGAAMAMQLGMMPAPGAGEGSGAGSAAGSGKP